MRTLLSKPFSPGSLIKGIADESVQLAVGAQNFLEMVLEVSDQQIDATFGEGYWVDHWTYNLDLIDSYLALFPDRLHSLLFSSEDLPYYDSPVIVNPRSKKYILVDGQPHQLGSLLEDHKKADMLAKRGVSSTWAKGGNGTGVVYRTSLFAKLFCLTVIKFATLDPFGMGIEMEAGRPGWYDALNGLPGLFGSSMPETYSLKRLITFLRNVLKEEKHGAVRLPVEMMCFLRRLVKENKHFQSNVSDERDYLYWDNVSAAREAYRASIRLGPNGAEEFLSFTELETFLGIFEAKVDAGIQRALSMNNGIPPTYFSYRVDEFVLLKDKKGFQRTDSQGRPYFHARRFTPQLFPLFLEGMVKAMSLAGSSPSKLLYKQVKESSLYDQKLKMYKVNAPLAGLPKDVGRARAFTPGWLENESIWLHMEYKYLLEVLRAGLYKEFFEDFKTALIPFLDPNVYGRSTLENSSFLVSSAHPDESIHGAGFVARLSGATAEFISMWRHMITGKRPFFVIEGQLCLTLKPILPGWLFTEDNTLSCRCLGGTTLIYHNPQRRDTFDQGSVIHSITLQPLDGEALELAGEVISSPYAQMVRDGLIRQIEVNFA